jgi:hypothetical protein
MPTPTTWSSTSDVPYTWTNNDIDSLIEGDKWTTAVVSYSFPDYGSWWCTDLSVGYGPKEMGLEPWSPNFAPLTASEQLNFRAAMTAWSTVANVQFVPVVETSTNVGDIRVAFTDQAVHTDDIAWSYSPSSTASSGDIWFNVKSKASSEQWNPGSHSFLSAIQSLGGALGLKDPSAGPRRVTSSARR